MRNPFRYRPLKPPIHINVILRSKADARSFSRQLKRLSKEWFKDMD